MNNFFYNKEAEEYFKMLENTNESYNLASQYVYETLNKGLESGDLLLLLSLIPYLETGDGHIVFQRNGEIRRILRILNIISMESKYLPSTFAFGCSNVEQLLEKYYLSLFAMRRIAFKLSDISLEEATYYLQNSPLSHFAVYIISSQELIDVNDDFSQSMQKIYINIWNQENLVQYQTLMATHT